MVFHEGATGPPNCVRFRLSPEVVIAVGARSKVPGEAMVGEEIELSVRHHHGDEMAPYERPIGDAMVGDASLFAREDGVEAAWAVVDGILGVATPVCPYEPGTRGPAEADRIIAGHGSWHGPARSEDGHR